MALVSQNLVALVSQNLMIFSTALHEYPKEKEGIKSETSSPSGAVQRDHPWLRAGQGGAAGTVWGQSRPQIY